MHEFVSATAGIRGEYRYRVTRVWDPTMPTITFVMLNPSIADAASSSPSCPRSPNGVEPLAQLACCSRHAQPDSLSHSPRSLMPFRSASRISLSVDYSLASPSGFHASDETTNQSSNENPPIDVTPAPQATHPVVSG